MELQLKRAKVIRRPWSIIRHWRTSDEQYAIEQSHIIYGQEDPYPDQYRVLVRDVFGWTIVSRHRSKPAAVRALQSLIKAARPKRKKSS